MIEHYDWTLLKIIREWNSLNLNSNFYVLWDSGLDKRLYTDTLSDVIWSNITIALEVITPIVTGGWQPKRDNFNFAILYWGIVFFDMDLKSALFDTGNSLRLILYTYTMSAMMNDHIYIRAMKQHIIISHKMLHITTKSQKLIFRHARD